MKEDRNAKSSWLIMALFATGFVCALALGYITRDMTEKKPAAGSDASPGEVEVLLRDGSTLGGRLDRLEASIGKSNQEALASLRKDIRQMALDRRLTDINSDLPVQLYQLRDKGKFAVTGSDRPLFTLIEFSDFQCPYCGQMALFLEDLIKKYPDKIRLVFVDRPLTSIHAYAYMAHEAALEAKAQGKFWEMYRYLFSHQKEVFPPGRPESQEDLEKKSQECLETLVNITGELGMDKEKMRASLVNHTHKKELDANLELAVSLQINSTPTVYMDAFFLLRDPNAIPMLINDAVTLE